MIAITKVRCVSCYNLYEAHLKECPWCHDTVSYPAEVTKTESEVIEEEERNEIIKAWENEKPDFKENKYNGS